MTITAIDRPFVVTFLATGTSYPMAADECQRLLNEYPAVTATRNRVVLHGHNTPDPRRRVVIRPATVGGGPAFVVVR
jgi:hypothetical protein